MSNDSQQIVSKAWNFAHVLRDDSLSYMAYTEHLAFLLLLKMADKMTKLPFRRPDKREQAVPFADLCTRQWLAQEPTSWQLVGSSAAARLSEAKPHP